MGQASVIEVSSEGGRGFLVRAAGHRFEVTVAGALVAELGAPDAPSLIRAAFQFLLEREPAGSILPRFDLGVIERYFPGWRSEMRRRFAAGSRPAP